ncbi:MULTISPECIES: RES family NAD+ phosphorylase [unclassified Shinella]|uniref:RES family NAD+ phosphorylase n=1 Tax=unclassified Shinella TaxID=2643062 RepID=UPI0009EBBF3A|nr:MULTISPECIES: RES family NAD+ phosphorylase [unclassified Shinella]
MKLYPAALTKITQAFKPKNYARIFPAAHKATPLGTGPGMARFSSVNGNFNTLYAASSLATAIAETIIRDRFEGGGARLLFSSELENSCIASISSISPLQLIDLRTDGCFQLGVTTDIASAKGWDDSRALAQHIHDHTTLDGFIYRSRLTGANCIAIFDRAVSVKLTAGKSTELAAVPQLPSALESLSTEIIL